MTTTIKLLIAIFLASIILYSCGEKTGGNPTIEFDHSGTYTYENDSVIVGDSVKVGFICKWNGNDLLKKFTTLRNNELIEKNTFELKDGLEGFGVEFWLYKTLNDDELWSFELLDNKDQKATLELTLYNKPGS